MQNLYICLFLDGKMRKGEIAWEFIVKAILAVALLLFVTIMIYMFKDKLVLAVAKFGEFLRFGG